MKITKLFAFGCILSMGLFACSESSPTVDPTSAGTRAVTNIVEGADIVEGNIVEGDIVEGADIVEGDIVEGADIVESAMKLQMIRKWTNGDQYMMLAIEGSYTANLGAGEIAGNWELNESDNTLTLTGESGADGKGAADKTVYNVENITDSELTVKDAAGTAITFKAE